MPCFGLIYFLQSAALHWRALVIRGRYEARDILQLSWICSARRLCARSQEKTFDEIAQKSWKVFLSERSSRPRQRQNKELCSCSRRRTPVAADGVETFHNFQRI